MVINLVVTELIVVITGSAYALFTSVPLLPLLTTLILVAIFFPILFYHPAGIVGQHPVSDIGEY